MRKVRKNRKGCLRHLKGRVSSERTEKMERVAAPHKGNKVMRKLGKNRKKTDNYKLITFNF